MSGSTQLPWQESPFELIPTPLYEYRKAGKEPDGFVNMASLMALVHNVWIRAFNTVYHVAPNVPKNDAKNFVEYSLLLCQMLKNHHDEEEKYMFPQIEEQAGVKGLMEVNKEQHGQSI
jgi:hypothetical protein